MHKFTGAVFVSVLALSVPSLVQAQTQAPETRPDPAPAADRHDDNFDWGWIGLLGLAGLLGLKRRDTVGDRERVAATTRR
jgi:hypothetical protein